MPDAITLDVDPSASRFARWLRALALALTALTAVACVLAVAWSPGPWRLGGALVTLLAFVAVARTLRADRRTGPRQLIIGSDGTLHVRSGTGSAAAAVRHCNGLYVCLQLPRGDLPVWSDALPATSWRRLRVACRWPGAQGSEPANGASWVGDRTK